MKQLFWIFFLPLFGCQLATSDTSSNIPHASLKTEDTSPAQAITTSAKTETVSKKKESKAVAISDDPPTKKKYAFAWLTDYDQSNMLINRIGVPFGYERTKVSAGSFTEWLRHLPLKSGKPDVLLFNGAKKGYQGAHYAVINMDVGSQDLQQCADATMRLRAEYLWQAEKKEAISFKFTSGHPARYQDWKSGKRPVIKGNKVSWVTKVKANDSYASFKKYLIKVYQFAGTASLDRELPSIPIDDLQSGDVFIQGGFPGHAVIVMDVAIEKRTGNKVFLLAQSYMPAQEIHLLVNPTNSGLSPWYSLEEVKQSGQLQTPEWGFKSSDLHRFK